MVENKATLGLRPNTPGEVRNPLGKNGRGPIKSLLDCMREVGGESHNVLQPDGSVKTMSFDAYTALCLKRMVGEILEACRTKEALPKGLMRFYDKAWDVWFSRRAPVDEAGQSMDGHRSLTVILSRESPSRPVEVIDVTPINDPSRTVVVEGGQ